MDAHPVSAPRPALILHIEVVPRGERRRAGASPVLLHAAQSQSGSINDLRPRAGEARGHFGRQLGQRGHIRQLWIAGDGTGHRRPQACILGRSVGDDGVGMGVPGAVPGLGTSIVQALPNHLGTTVSVENSEPGTLVSIVQDGGDAPLHHLVSDTRRVRGAIRIARWTHESNGTNRVS